MPGHDIIVIGTSAGGLKALGRVLGALPPNLDATLFIVQHLAADKPSLVESRIAEQQMNTQEFLENVEAIAFLNLPINLRKMRSPPCSSSL